MTTDNAALLTEEEFAAIEGRFREGRAQEFGDLLDDIHDLLGSHKAIASALEAAERRVKELEDENKRFANEAARRTSENYQLTNKLDALAAEAAALRERLRQINSLRYDSGADHIIRALAIAGAALSLTPSAAAQRMGEEKAALLAIQSIMARYTQWEHPLAVSIRKALAAIDHPEAGKDAT